MELLSHNASSPDPLHQEVIYKRPLAYQKMENLIKEMQDPEHGVPVRSQKLFLTSIPAAFAGYDIIEWLMERLSIEDSVEAIHLANLLCQHGYFFPVGDNRALSVKDDSSLYRFQTPYYWPSQVPCLDSVDYAIWLVKRTLRNKQKHGLDDYEIDALNNLRKTLTQKWDFISMQADEQVRISKDRKKVDKMVTDSQERAFWRVLRPPPGFTSCVETPPMHMADFHANEGVKQIRRTNLIEDLRAEVDLLRISCLRSRTKVSQALESLASHCDSYNEHDAFLVPRQPSNPWITEDTYFWILNAPLVDIPTERRVKKWAISMENLVYDLTGLREFTAYLKKEYCHENIRFWTAVRDLRFGPISQLRVKAQQIYNEFLSPGAPCEINIDMRTMDAVQKEMNYLTPSRFTFDPAANHVYAMLLKKDCYPRFIRSENYKSILANAVQPNQKKRFFNFSAPAKKKSSATNPLIFPVGSQTATAGVGEVLKITDEVLLLTTGNKPSDFGGIRGDSEKTSDIPYRGDMIPDQKSIDSIPARKALSQSSFDDVCPWESMERLPEKEPKLSTSLVASKYDSPPPPQKSSSIKPASIVSKLTGSIPSLISGVNPGTCSASIPIQSQQLIAPIAIGFSQSVSPVSGAIVPGVCSTITPIQSQHVVASSSNSQSTHRLSSTSNESCPPIPATTVIALAQPRENSQALGAQSQLSEITLPINLPSQASITSISGSIKIEEIPESSSSRRSSQTAVLTQIPNSKILPQSSLSGDSSELIDPPPDQNQNVEQRESTTSKVFGEEPVADTTGDGSSNPALGVKKKGGPPRSLVEVCPWDHENGSQPDGTTFTKTYSTLGYL